MLQFGNRSIARIKEGKKTKVFFFKKKLCRLQHIFMAMAMSEKHESLKNSVVEVIFVDIENFAKDFAHTKDSPFDDFNI